jgi:hypothetical protein
MHTNILAQGKFKSLDVNTNPDQYADHLKNKYGNHFFLKDPNFATLHLHIVQ